MGRTPVPAGYLVGRAPVLLRLAHQLTGDAEAAREAVCRAAATLRDRASDLDLDRAATAALARAARRSEVTDTGTDLDWLAGRARAAVVLAFGLDWDATTIAEVTRRPTHRVRRDVAFALRHRPEAHWRLLLDDERWTIPVPADLVDGVTWTRRAMRSRRTTALLAGGVAGTLLAGVVSAGVRIADRPPPLPPAATDPGLLPWEPRGPLVRDQRFVAAAMRAWRDVAPPTGGIHVLWAGRIGIGRAAVLQAALSDGDGLVALVADHHDFAVEEPRLRLEGVWPISDPAGPAVVVPYDGNLGISGLENGPGSRVVQLLVAPDVVGVESRAPRQVSPTRPEFEVELLTDGVSSAWLDLTDDTNAAVRLRRADGSAVVGLLPDGGVQLVALHPEVSGPPEEWAGLAPTDTAPLADDAVWWAQLCRSPLVEVQLVWERRVPAFPSPVRLEFVTCPDERTVAHFLTGVGPGTQEISASDRTADAYRVDLVPPGGGPASVAVVGSQRVTMIRGHDQVVHDRVAVLRIDEVVDLRVLDGAGRLLTVG